MPSWFRGGDLYDGADSNGMNHITVGDELRQLSLVEIQRIYLNTTMDLSKYPDKIMIYTTTISLNI